MQEIIILILLTLTPIFELRASIPYGLSVGINLWFVLLIAIIANIFTALIAYSVIEYVIPVFRKISWIDKLYNKWVLRTQKRVKKKVNKYGTLGLALFIAVPLPGSGVWTGALASNILGINFRNFFKASLVGVIIAGIAVTFIVVAGLSILGL